jgi:hypothetical protein
MVVVGEKYRNLVTEMRGESLSNLKVPWHKPALFMVAESSGLRRGAAPGTGYTRTLPIGRGLVFCQTELKK